MCFLGKPIEFYFDMRIHKAKPVRVNIRHQRTVQTPLSPDASLSRGEESFTKTFSFRLGTIVCFEMAEPEVYVAIGPIAL
jgi:hypothetical protein